MVGSKVLWIALGLRLLLTSSFHVSSFVAVRSHHHLLHEKTQARAFLSISLSSIVNKERWEHIREQIPSVDAEQPSVLDSARQKDTTPVLDSKKELTFYQERHRWCPYSERVFLALELNRKSVPFNTVLIDNTGHGPRPSYFSGRTTPQIQWHCDGSMQGESMDLVTELDQRYQLGLQSEIPRVQDFVHEFRKIFPQRARPSSRAAFLFQYNGEPLGRSTFKECLHKVNDLITGPFFCGNELTVADIAFVPFLERYRYQLPCLHEGLHPKDPVLYPNLARWFDAMESIPAYVCRVSGDASSWRKVLSMAGFGNSGVPPTIQENMEKRLEQEIQEAQRYSELTDLWSSYSSDRDFVAETASKEAAAIVFRNRDAILNDTLKHASRFGEMCLKSEGNLEGYLIEVVEALAMGGGGRLSEGGQALARWLDQRMCVPRDMGVPPASCVKLLAYGMKQN